MSDVSPMDSCWRGAFDGSALPNPGQMAIGAVLCAPDGRSFKLAHRAGKYGCNNEAELLALCALLELALAHGVENLWICGDSEVAVSYVLVRRTTQIARFLPLIECAQGLMRRFAHVELQWVPRHRNKESDALARQVLGLSVEK